MSKTNMRSAMKRVVTIQDMSCFGKCSITVALPIISAAGVELCPVPNILLSTHTGGFTDMARCDLTTFIADTARHWNTLGLMFDAIYIGYLGAASQFPIVAEFIDMFRTNNTVLIVDPAMGDQGQLYNGCTPDFPAAMARLCAKADYVVPNLTEAALLLQRPYVADGHSQEYTDVLLQGLLELGARNAVITGVTDTDGNIGAAYQSSDAQRGYTMMRRFDGTIYHGAGDTFASCFVAALMRGLTLQQSVHAAVQFTGRVIEQTMLAKTDPRFGLHFESCIPEMLHLLDIHAIPDSL